MDRTCLLDGCERPHNAKGYCMAHYSRLRRTGNAGAVEVWNKAPKSCSVDDCTRMASSRGMCDMHYLRWYRHGDTDSRSHYGEGHERWLDRSDLNYDAAHDRVKRRRGAASIHACRCGKRAEDWAYLHTDPDPLTDERGRPFSDNIDAYAAMCRSCHKTFDWQIKRETVLKMDEVQAS